MLVYRTAVKYKLKKPITKFQEINKSQLPITNDKNRSFCDFCGRQLHWYENVPVISWVIQGGITRCCQKKLPLLYPIAELTTGLLFIVYLWQIKFAIYDWRVVPSLIMLTMIVFSTVFDVKYMILPDFATVIMGICAMLLFGYQGVVAAGVAGAFLGLLYLGTRGRGIGFGDVKLALFMGLLLGLSRVIVAFYVAFIVGAIIGVVLMIKGKVGRKTAIPFGPFLLLGTVAAWWYGNSLWYIVFNR